jgi:S1-C subfamily serine protease
MKRIMARAACLLTAAILITVCAAPAALANSRVNAARESVVRVVTTDEYNWILGTGTAFVIGHSGGSTTLVTNRHVVDFPDFPHANVYILTDERTSSRVPAQITVHFPVELDLVILTVTSGLGHETWPALSLANVNTVSAADRAYALGFPGAADYARDDWSLLPSRTENVTVTSGVIGQTRVEMDGVRYLQSDVPITFGNSGGPLLNESGQVIGVNTSILQEGSYGVSYSIYIDYIIDECKARGIPFVAASSGGFLAEYWWLLAIAGGVILLAVLAIVIALIARPKTARQPVAAPMPQPVAQPMPQPVHAGPVYPQQASGRSQLLCTKGHFAGTTFPINGVVPIGRDPQRCQVIYPAETKGISSLHCELSLQPGGVTLTDKGSSYGTFLANGRKLGPNESAVLNPGDSFYLADPKNEFKVL